MPGDNLAILSLDVGEVRIGVAEGSTLARIAHPLKTIARASVASELGQLLAEYQPQHIIVGQPRNANGETTAQTQYVYDFVNEFLADQSVIYQDESVTSVRAEQELEARRKPYTKGDIDALAAAYILQDYLDGI